MEADLGACLERDLGTSVEEDMETGLDIRMVPQRGPPSSWRLGPQRHAGSEHANCTLQPREGGASTKEPSAATTGTATAAATTGAATGAATTDGQ